VDLVVLKSVINKQVISFILTIYIYFIQSFSTPLRRASFSELDVSFTQFLPPDVKLYARAADPYILYF
jgi:hypothetical protein